MSHIKLVVISVLTISTTINAVNFPPKFLRCNEQKAGAALDDCLKNAIVKNLAQMTYDDKARGIRNLKPLAIDEIKMDQGSGPVQVLQSYRDVKLEGFSEFVLETIPHFDYERKTLNATGNFPKIVQTSPKTKVEGKILALPVYGEGESVITLNNMRVAFLIHLEEFRRDGATRYKVSDYELTLLNVERVEFRYEDLFNGDAKLTDNINKVLNENWRDVFDDMKATFTRVYGTIAKRVANDFLTKYRVDQLLQANVK